MLSCETVTEQGFDSLTTLLFTLPDQNIPPHSVSLLPCSTMAIHRVKSAKPPAQNGVANPSASVADIVSGVIAAVTQRGDEAVNEYALKFDKVAPKLLSVSRHFII